MSKLTRRDFIKSSVAVGTGLVLAAPHSRVRGANNDIRLAVVGVGRQGSGHCNNFGRLSGVRLVAICDADQAHIDQILKDRGTTNIKTYRDVRKLLDDKEIDVITSATPNHWHSLVTVWACQAGKDVYIEKPVSHEIWEGRKMVEAARKYNRIVQTGTQKRSSEAHKEAYQWIKEGNLGAIKWVRGFCYKPRLNNDGMITELKEPKPLPETIDYNLWCGPAEMRPFRWDALHYKWHWLWNTGCGEVGNQGIHEMDLARWALGQKGLPERVMSIGGRFTFNDAGETANTQIAFLDYKPAPLIFEVRGLPRKKGDKAMDYYRKVTQIGIVVQCEKGYLAAGDGGGWVWDNNGNRTDKQFSGRGGSGHHQNFIDAVRSRKVGDLNADIEEGFFSSSLCHMANISYRLGKKTPVEEIKAALGSNTEVMDSFNRMLEHLSVNEVDLAKEPVTMGPMLTMDPKAERFVGQWSNEANVFIKRKYREPFVVPDAV